MLRNKKIVLSATIVVVLLLSLSAIAYAHSSSYSMSVGPGASAVEYGSHIYGDSSDTYCYDNNSSANSWYQFKLHCVTCNNSASVYKNVYIGSSATTPLFPAHRSSSHKLRYKHYNTYSNGTNNVSGRYGVD